MEKVSHVFVTLCCTCAPGACVFCTCMGAEQLGAALQLVVLFRRAAHAGLRTVRDRSEAEPWLTPMCLLRIFFLVYITIIVFAMISHLARLFLLSVCGDVFTYRGSCW